MTDLRVTWVQPEDLIGHELRQASEDGRDATAVSHRWHTAGGAPAPPRAGASPAPPSPGLRALAGELLDELARLPSAREQDEPTDLAAIRSACPDWPAARDAREGPGPRTAGARPADTPPRPRAGATASVPPDRPPPGRAPVDPAVARLHAAWLGRAAGCLLGKPVEKLPLRGIRAIARATGNWPLHTWFTAEGLPRDLADAYPWNRRSAPTSLAENIDGMPEDDDLSYPVLNLLLLQRHGRDFTTSDVARLWLDELPAGRTFTAERVAYRNLLCGIEPPHTARYRNPYREWIGAAIRADTHGWTHPGDPGAAAAQAHREATLTHTANGVYSAMFVAATVAAAAGPADIRTGPADRGTGAAGARTAGPPDVHACLRAGLSVVPPASRLAEAVRLGIESARAQADFAAVVDLLHSAYGHYHWVHAVPNAALLAAALTHADGDFGGSICRAVSGGWDTDSNGATAGSVAGLLTGDPAGLPERWTAPLKNRLATSVAGLDGIGFDTLAELTRREALRP
ncbi:ADP-ribosylglycohydrolase family protein [Streptomyces lushanensis]|uniref:ADP-ribosylglycohydrolase family protein n=1 Tax=Streptomyces lushanensis TaxID=1434255 RepID=UPI000832ABAA|nr:ADP-ribosylglycohydrolase family protein [Streptomyces lushanensis]